MTREDILSFLRYSGVTVESCSDESEPVVFNNRGVSVAAFPYEDGDLMHLTYQVECPATIPPPDRAFALLRAIEDGLPVVKLRPGDDGWKTLVVSAEQFEPAGPAAGNVFWRTVDLLVDAAGECIERLKAESDAPETNRTATPSAEGAWFRELEKSLRAGVSRKRVHAQAEGEDATFDAVLRGLALLVDAAGGSGSAFCVERSPERTLYVTCAHAVKGFEEVTLYAQRPKFRKFRATVLARDDGENGDLALLSAPASDFARPLVLAKAAPAPRTRVAMAGYPRVQLFAAETFGELVPAIRFGYVVAALAKGSCILHDAISRPGNSGGPLFDVRTGEVVGVEQGGWAAEEESSAIGAAALRAFLRQHTTTR